MVDELQLCAQALVAMHMFFANAGLRDAALLRGRVRRLLRESTMLTPGGRFVGELICLRPTVMRLARKLCAGVRSVDPETRWIALLTRANIRENAGDTTGSMRDSLRAMRDLGAGDVWGTAMSGVRRCCSSIWPN